MARIAGVVFVLLVLAWVLILAGRPREQRTVRRVDAGGAQVVTATG